MAAYWFAVNAISEVDAKTLIPTGNLLETKPGTQWYFRKPKTLRDSSGAAIGYDGNMVLDDGRDLADPVAIVTSPTGDLTLRQWTDRRGLQFYNAMMTNAPKGIGLNGKTYGKYSGFCLEDQAFPDAVHHPHFPNIIITPDKPYSHWCEFEIK